MALRHLLHAVGGGGWRLQQQLMMGMRKTYDTDPECYDGRASIYRAAALKSFLFSGF